jgi:hypothetical protein
MEQKKTYTMEKFQQVNKIYCHNGHDLCMDSDKADKGIYKLRLIAIHAGGESETILKVNEQASQLSFDFSKDYSNEHVKSFACPVCREELDSIASCNCGSDNRFQALYFNPKRSFSTCIGLCTNPKCDKSFKYSAWKILASFVDGQL